MRRRAHREAAGDRAGGGRLLRRRRRRPGCGARGDEPRGDVELPVVFICENNQFALSADWRSSARSRTSPIARPATGCRARSSTETTCRGRGRGGRRSSGRGRRRADVPRDEDVPADAALDARQPARRARPGVVEEWEAKDPLPRFERASGLGSSTTSALGGVARGVERRGRGGGRAAMADEDASADDLLPAVFGAHTRYPCPPRTGDARLRRGDSRGARARAPRRPRRDRDRRGHRQGRRPLPRHGGALRAYGPERIRDTPLTESGFVGCGIGAALTGLRPVVELQFSDFSGVALDQIVNQAAKLRFMMGGTPSMPLVIRMVAAAAFGSARSTRRASRRSSRTSRARGRDAVNRSTRRGCSPRRSGTTTRSSSSSRSSCSSARPRPCRPSATGSSSGSAHRARGTDVTVVALGAQVPHALRAAHELEGTASASRSSTRARSSRSTPTDRRLGGEDGRLVVAHEAVRFCGFGGEIAAHVGGALLLGSRRPGRPRGRPSHPMPYQKDLEAATLPGPAEIAAAVRSVVEAA